MDIYNQKSTWKIYLAIIGAVIVIVTMIYSSYLARRLADMERSRVELFAEALKSVATNNDNLQDNQNVEFLIVQKISDIPVILEDEEGNLQGENFGKEVTESYLQKQKEKFLSSGKEPIESIGYSRYIYYRNSRLYSYIKWFPIIQFMMLAAFMLLGYVGFSASRKAEQNRVWAGMAKETAHQLGTPISAIIAWIEYLKQETTVDEHQTDVLDELRSDVSRLELIADRFSKIGSKPILVKSNLIDDVSRSMQYMQKRASKKIVFETTTDSRPIFAEVNHHLFEWVVENLIRNSLDAMDDTGSIHADVYEDGNWAVIDIKDTGKGIPMNKFKTVFEPGYSTKKRGWGLGLSLAKRIIENYHKGKIFVKTSKHNEGTTFTIHLPLVGH